MAGVRLQDILHAACYALAGDSALRGFCLDTLGREPMVQVLYDPNAAAEVDYCPALVLVPERRTGGDETDERRLELTCWIRLREDRHQASLAGGLRIREYHMAARLEELAEFAIEAIAADLHGRGLALAEWEIGRFSFGDPSVANWPVAIAGLRIVINTPAYVGGETQFEQ
jgi:hypothetical protein